MIVIGTFEHSIELEQALAVLEQEGIARPRLLVISMDSEFDPPSPLTNISKDLRTTGTELGIACATGFAVLGACVGFVLTWGPLIWGMISAVVGYGIGYLIGYSIYRKHLKQGRAKRLPKRLPEVAVIVQCQEKESPRVKEIMWTYLAISVGVAPDPG